MPGPDEDASQRDCALELALRGGDRFGCNCGQLEQSKLPFHLATKPGDAMVQFHADVDSRDRGTRTYLRRRPLRLSSPSLGTGELDLLLFQGFS